MAVTTRRAKKTPKKSSSRPKATSRSKTGRAVVQVPATPSPRTLSPDIIEETQANPPSNEDLVRRLVEQELAKVGERRLGDQQRDPQARKSQAEAYNSEKSISKLIQRALAEARDRRDDSDSQDSYRVHKSRRRRHRRRYYSSDSSTDSEDGKRPKVSFLDQDKGTQDQALRELAFVFPTVVLKYFKQIYYGTFQPENLTKLGQGMADKMSSDTAQEVREMVHLGHCMEVYSQIVLQFAHPTQLRKLQRALAKYRIRLAELSATYKFESVREYNATFLRQRILLGQDDPIAWSVIDSEISDRLVRKAGSNETPKHASGAAFKSLPHGLGICHNFNEGRCTREHCKYSHICLNC